MYARTLRRAREKDVPHKITVEDVEEAWKASGQVCPVYGVELKRSKSGHGEKNSPTLICIDYDRGYVRGNIMVVSHQAKDHHFTADNPSSLIGESPSIHESIFDFAEGRIVRNDLLPDAAGEFTLRYNKAKIRSSIYCPLAPAFGRALLLPGTDLTDVMMGLKHYMFDETTSFLLVEQDAENAKIIKRRYAPEDQSVSRVDRWLDKYVGRPRNVISHEERFTLLQKSLEDLEVEDLGNEEIDFVNLDTCNVYSEKLDRMLSEVLYPNLAHSCLVTLVLVDRYGSGSCWGARKDRKQKMSARNWTRRRIQNALPNLELVKEHIYKDRGRMWVLRFARGTHLKIQEVEKALMAELTEKQQVVYDSLATPGQKAHYRRELNLASTAHDKQNITRRYMKKIGCRNFKELRQKIRKANLG